MKHQFRTPVLLLLFIGAYWVLGFQGCKSDPCKDVVCQNGSCIDGTCQCPAGYSGSQCEIHDPCYAVDCGHGTCNGGTCNCDPGWMGTHCDTPDPCYGVTCLNGGNCVNGVCQCPFGWEGADCTSPINAKCHGNYAFIEDCSSTGHAGPYNIYLAPIYPYPTSNVFFEMTGIWEEPNYTVRAILGGNGRTFVINRQSIALYYEIESLGGTVSANGDTLTLEYTVYSGGSSTIVETCTGTMVKQ